MLLYSLYQTILTLFFALLYPFLFLIGRLQKGKSYGVVQRFCVDDLFPSRKDAGSLTLRIWIHAASVGEVQAARILIDELNARHDGVEYFLSTMTKHGRGVAEKQLPPEVTCFLAPLDIPIVVRRFLSTVEPDLYVCMETELWPAMFIELQRSGTPSMILNGRMSPRSFQRYSMIRSLIGAVLGSLSATAVISEVDSRRFKELGAPSETLSVTGNIKYDFPGLDLPEIRRVHRELIQAGEDVVFICGSTRSGEEQILLSVFQTLKRNCDKHLIWVIAPRHLERLEYIKKFLSRNGLEFDLYSNMKKKGRTCDVILVDSMGDLSHLYSAGDLNFVGGSLVNNRGHNIMEAARWGRPVYYGPSIDDFNDAADILEHAGGGFRVENGEELAKVLIEHLGDKTMYNKACENAANAVSLQQGAAGRQVNMVLKLLLDAA